MFKVETLVGAKSALDRPLLGYKMKIGVGLSKQAIPGHVGTRSGFQLGLKLREFDQWHANQAQRLAHRYCLEKGLKISSQNSPSISIGDFSVRMYGRNFVDVLDEVTTPYFLESRGHQPQSHHFYEESFDVDSVCAWLVRNPVTGRKLAEPRVICEKFMIDDK